MSVSVKGCTMLYRVPLVRQIPVRYTLSVPFENSIRRYPTKPFQTATSPRPCSSAFVPLKYSSNAAAMGLTEAGICR